MREELQPVESQSMMFENEMKSLITQKQAPAQRLAQNPPVVKTVPEQSSAKPTKERKVTNPSQRSYAQIATLSSAKNATERSQTEATNSSRKKKGNSPNPPKLKPKKRRVIFQNELASHQKSEADLMLVLNELLQKTRVSVYIQFSRVRYAQSGTILTLLTEKSSAENLVREHSNLLIRAAKSVDKGVIGVEALER